jgi:hypothetical protein
MIDDIYTRGFVKFQEPDALDLISINDFKLVNVEERTRDNGIKDVHEELARRLGVFANFIKEKYVDPHWPAAKYNKFIVWNGVDRDNQGWHTDMFENYDVFFLYYLDNTRAETGGSINFKWGVLENNEQTASFQPQAGDLFMINNQRGFWHRADSTSIQRRVASFDFTVGLQDGNK